MRAKSGVVTPSVFNLPYSCEHQYNVHTTTLPISTLQQAKIFDADLRLCFLLIGSPMMLVYTCAAAGTRPPRSRARSERSYRTWCGRSNTGYSAIDTIPTQPRQDPQDLLIKLTNRIDEIFLNMFTWAGGPALKYSIHCKKRLVISLSQARMSLTKLFLAENN